MATHRPVTPWERGPTSGWFIPDLDISNWWHSIQLDTSTTWTLSPTWRDGTLRYTDLCAIQCVYIVKTWCHSLHAWTSISSWCSHCGASRNANPECWGVWFEFYPPRGSCKKWSRRHRAVVQQDSAFRTEFRRHGTSPTWPSFGAAPWARSSLCTFGNRIA